MSTRDLSTRVDLTLAEVVAESGVAEATISRWQARVGFPEWSRDVAGRPSYRADVVPALRQVDRDLAAGVSLEDAVVAASRTTEAWRPETPSIYAAVRESLGDVVVRTLTKRTVLGLAWAIEDECMARAHQPLLFGAFQHERHFAPARQRWAALAVRARATVTLMCPDEGLTPVETPGVQYVPLAPDAPMVREWAVVCDAVDRSAVLTAWELPGQDDVPDLDRQFESVWTLDPATVRRASRVAAEVAVAARVPGAADLKRELGGPAVVTRPDPRSIERFHHRALAYVDRLAR